MDTKSLKEKVIKSIENVTDDNVLQSLLNLIELESDKDVVYEFSEDQLAMIELAKQQIREGKTLTNEEVNKEIEEWLNK